MPGIYEYTLLMQDRASGTLQKLSGSSYEAVQKFVTLQDRIDTLKRSSGDFGNSIDTLKQRIDILQQERDLIDPENLTKIRQYNREIQTLSTRINNLENTTGGRFKTYLKDAFSQIPGANLLTNPLILAGAGVTAAGKLAVSWEEGMAKINATAQLPQAELDKLGKTIKKLGIEAGVNLSKVPDAYEKILSQTGDVALSTDILDKALKGAKAGFTDVDIVSGAVAQSLSAIGKENTNAQEVLDTLFAAKRVGAGEFGDFARYVPGLVAAGKNIGVIWKETAGAFAYMTGKGNDAASSAMYIQNAYSALGKSDITDGLKKAGVNVYDGGKLRSIVDIFTDLSKVTQAMNDQQKSDFFEKIGLRDQQAKAAFSILTDETSKLQEAMNATANASGELQAALDNTDNIGNKLKTTWAQLQGIGETFGNGVITLLNPVLDILNGLLSGIAWTIEGVGSVWSWWTNMLIDGNPWIVGLTVLIGGLSAAVAAHTLWMKHDVLWTKITITAKKTWAAVTGFVSGAIKALNATLATTPFGWILAGVGAVIAVYTIWHKKISDVTIAQRTMSKIENEAWKSIAERKVKLEALTKIISDSSRAENDRAKALTELQRLYPKDFEHLTTQNALTGKAIELKQKLIDKLFQEAKVRAAQDKLTELEKQRFDLLNDSEKSDASLFQQIGNSFLAGGNALLTQSLNMQSSAKNLTEGLNQIDKKSETLRKFLESSNALEVIVGGNENGGGGTGGNLNLNLGSDSLSLGIPQNYNANGAYAAITSKLGGKSASESDKQSPTETPVRSIAARVDDISVSLRKIAASVAIPVALSVGVANASAASETMIQNHANSMIDQRYEVGQINNHASYDYSRNLTDLSNKISKTSNLSNITTNDYSRSVADSSNRISNTNNLSKVVATDNSRKVSELSQRFEQTSSAVSNEKNSLYNKVSGGATYDYSRTVSDSSNRISNTNNLSKVVATDNSRKISELSQLFEQTSSAVSNEENNLFRNIQSTALAYENSSSTNNNETFSSKAETVSQSHSRVIHIDRFTDKIEIHVTGQDAPREVADRIRDEVEKALAEILNV